MMSLRLAERKGGGFALGHASDPDNDFGFGTEITYAKPVKIRGTCNHQDHAGMVV
jgi:hypothetical protein